MQSYAVIHVGVEACDSIAYWINLNLKFLKKAQHVEYVNSRRPLPWKNTLSFNFVFIFSFDHKFFVRRLTYAVHKAVVHLQHFDDASV
jgi:hypothetical protein